MTLSGKRVTTSATTNENERQRVATNGRELIFLLIANKRGT